MIASSGALSVGTWHHVAARYDGAQMELFLDGQNVGSMAKTGTLAPSAEPVWLGNNPPSATRGLDGTLDHVFLFDRSLSDFEILALAGDLERPGIRALGHGSPTCLGEIDLEILQPVDTDDEAITFVGAHAPVDRAGFLLISRPDRAVRLGAELFIDPNLFLSFRFATDGAGGFELTLPDRSRVAERRVLDPGGVLGAGSLPGRSGGRVVRWPGVPDHNAASRDDASSGLDPAPCSDADADADAGTGCPDRARSIVGSECACWWPSRFRRGASALPAYGVEPGHLRGVPPDNAQLGSFPNGVGPATQHGATLTPSGGDDWSAIQGALDGAAAVASKASRRYVQLGAGTFQVGSKITVPSYVVLRGTLSGTTRQTVLNQTFSGTAVEIIGGSGGQWGSVVPTAGVQHKGAAAIVVSDGSQFAVGDVIAIDHVSDGTRWGRRTAASSGTSPRRPASSSPG